MIKIDFQEPTSKEWKSWRRSCQRQQAKHDLAISGGGHPRVSGLYTKQKAEYKRASKNKCAYCEAHIESDQYVDVDHYRPKDAVTDENGTTVMVQAADGGQSSHRGYYWLAYDWRNLLPSCVQCNQLFKRTKFPVQGQRATAEAEEKNESPLLINPVMEDPAAYLHVDETGMILGESDKAKATIRLLNLNGRSLPDQRRDAYEDAQDRYRLLLLADEKSGPDSAESRRYRERILRIETGMVPFAAAARAGLEHERANRAGGDG